MASPVAQPASRPLTMDVCRSEGARLAVQTAALLRLKLGSGATRVERPGPPRTATPRSWAHRRRPLSPICGGGHRRARGPRRMVVPGRDWRSGGVPPGSGLRVDAGTAVRLGEHPMPSAGARACAVQLPEPPRCFPREAPALSGSSTSPRTRSPTAAATWIPQPRSRTPADCAPTAPTSSSWVLPPVTRAPRRSPPRRSGGGWPRSWSGSPRTGSRSRWTRSGLRPCGSPSRPARRTSTTSTGSVTRACTRSWRRRSAGWSSCTPCRRPGPPPKC